MNQNNGRWLRGLGRVWWVVVVGSLIAFVIYMTITGFGDMIRLSSEASEFALEIRDGRYEAAYARTSDAYRETTTLEQFRTAVSVSPYWRGAKRVSFNTLERNGGAARASGSLTSTAGDVLVDFDFTTKGDVDTIAGVRVAGVPQLVGPATH
jgi:hypothetical protein